ncbi:MAG: FAD/NAD(P)-binding protein [Candidatus Melainabacteria bacterium]|nr:FAD/NAD(P)-binding protein [Candidatus Melainabacteria bacterium]
MLDCLIIGGGIHGTHLATRLVTREGLPLDRIRILDPNDAPCQRWKDLTGRTGMRFLRSPIVHHLDVDPWSLMKFMERPDVRPWASTIGPKQQPSLRLFNAHIDHVLDKSGIYKIYRRGLALGIKDRGTHLEVETSAGSIESRKVILAISSNETPRMPDWLANLVSEGAPVRHIFEPGFSRHSIIPSFTYAVIGSGLSAVQLSLAIARKAPGRVLLMTKGPLEVAELDFDPCWIGPKCQEPFGKVPDYGKRRSIVTAARNAGTIPEAISRSLEQDESRGLLKVLRSRATAGSQTSDGRVILTLANGQTHTVDRVLVAIGFEKSAPGESWLQTVAGDIGLVTHSDGYPVVDKNLRWHERILVTGALAELEVGAAARNIVGARIAGDRIGPLFRG